MAKYLKLNLRKMVPVTPMGKSYDLAQEILKGGGRRRQTGGGSTADADAGEKRVRGRAGEEDNG
jgi:hypothetical protein